MSTQWRVGRSVGRTVYIGDKLVGLMDTPELARQVVDAVNEIACLRVAHRKLGEAAYAVVELMDKPIVGNSTEAAAAWKAAKRLCKVLNEEHGHATGSSQ